MISGTVTKLSPEPSPDNLSPEPSWQRSSVRHLFFVQFYDTINVGDDYEQENKVLVVDDDVNICELIRLTLKRM